MTKNPELSVEASEAANTGEAEEQRQERIRQRAHELYIARGQEVGHDLDDWLQAEVEIGTGEAVPEHP